MAKTPSETSSPTKSDTIVGIDSFSALKANKNERKHFSIIWHQLANRVDARPLYLKLRSRIFPSNDSQVSTEGANSRVAQKSGEKLILDHVSGEARSGEITAILGPSGAGKSTLLHCLFQNRTDGTSGRILVDGCTKKRLKICFIPQQDHLNEWLTVREDLMFVSRLKFAGLSNVSGDDCNEKLSNSNHGASTVDHEANAVRVAELLRLESCLDVRIKKISGGQRKRLSIARELMSKPDILVLDEPTTGLDSLTCIKTIQVLRDLLRLSTNPMAVVVTIHQPEKKVFNLFDRALFISSGGRVIYDNHPKNVAQTLEMIAGVKLASPSHNPASYLIRISSDLQQSAAVKLLADHYQAKFSAKFGSACIQKLMRSSTPTTGLTPEAIRRNSDFLSDRGEKLEAVQLPADRPNANDYFICHQLKDCRSGHGGHLVQTFLHILILTNRAWISQMRNPTFTKSRLVFHILLPLTMLLVYGLEFGSKNMCPKYESEVSFEQMLDSVENGNIEATVKEMQVAEASVSFYFMLVYSLGINIITSTAAHYPLTMYMYKKEVINGLYSPVAHFIGHTLAEIPLEILFPSISILLSYHITGNPSSPYEWRMFAIAFLVSLSSYTMHAIGLLFGSIFVDDANLAILASYSSLTPAVCLSGCMFTVMRMPDWMMLLTETSIFRQVMAGILAARYAFNQCNCDPDEVSPDGPVVSGMSPQVRQVVDYLFPKTNDTSVVGDSFGGRQVAVNDLFDQLAAKFVKAQTFGRDIRSCEDMKPYVLHVHRVDDGDLSHSIVSVLVIIAILKSATFLSIRSFPYRLN